LVGEAVAVMTLLQNPGIFTLYNTEESFQNKLSPLQGASGGRHRQRVVDPPEPDIRAVTT
jgi:hypothetical protein